MQALQVWGHAHLYAKRNEHGIMGLVAPDCMHEAGRGLRGPAKCSSWWYTFWYWKYLGWQFWVKRFVYSGPVAIPSSLPPSYGSVIDEMFHRPWSSVLTRYRTQLTSPGPFTATSQKYLRIFYIAKRGKAQLQVDPPQPWCPSVNSCSVV